MKYNKNKLAIIILISVMAISACTQSYSQAPAATPTLIPPGLFHRSHLWKTRWQ
jgi:hypothetical protein